MAKEPAKIKCSNQDEKLTPPNHHQHGVFRDGDHLINVPIISPSSDPLFRLVIIYFFTFRYQENKIS